MLGTLRQRGVDEESLARVRSPAGLDLGPSGQAEIGVAVLAEFVAWRNARAGGRAEAASSAEALDPVCGMTVAVEGAPATAVHEGITYFCCCPGCRTRFETDPARYLTAATS